MNTPPTDLRSRLQAIADGTAAKSAGNVVSADAVHRHQSAYRAWHRFAFHGNQGEALTAPAALLPPPV